PERHPARVGELAEERVVRDLRGADLADDAPATIEDPDQRVVAPDGRQLELADGPHGGDAPVMRRGGWRGRRRVEPPGRTAAREAQRRAIRLDRPDLALPGVDGGDGSGQRPAVRRAALEHVPDGAVPT